MPSRHTTVALQMTLLGPATNRCDRFLDIKWPRQRPPTSFANICLAWRTSEALAEQPKKPPSTQRLRIFSITLAKRYSHKSSVTVSSAIRGPIIPTSASIPRARYSPASHAKAKSRSVA